MTAQTTKLQKGFTLIELLVVIGILAILLAITLIAINPARQFAQANNTKRSSDVNAILNAIGQYQAENHGALPANMPAAGAAAVEVKQGAAANVGDICASLVTQYIAQLPVDPLTNNGTAVAATCPAGYATNYWVAVAAGTDKRVTVNAPAAELSATISVTR
jgi:prepilin-type N-terminal cleavage/methylation domain-containing protein